MSIGNENNPLKARMQGVRTARDGTAASAGKPQTVTNVVVGEVVFVGFNNERGEPQTALYFKVGDQYYAPADTVAWCSQLRPMTEWLAAGVAEKFKDQAPVTVPREDAVDVLGGGDEASPE